MNTPPVAVDDRATTQQNTPVMFSVTGNDGDADGRIEPSTVDLEPSVAGRQVSVVVSGEGEFVADNAGNVTFTPDASFVGDTAISYTVEDDQGAVSNPALITVTVITGPEPVLGVAKAASVSGNEVTLTLRMANLGEVALSNLSLIDDLDATFGAGNYTVRAPSIVTPPATSAIVLNPGYTGAAGEGAELLDGVNSTLAVGEFADIAVTVTVTTVTDRGNGVGVYANMAIGAGDPPRGARDRVTDNSTDGLDPDPNNDGRPDEMTPTPIVVDDVVPPPPPPLPPLAVDDSAITPQNTPVTFSVTDNDRDPDGAIVPATVDLDPSVADRQADVAVPGEGAFAVDEFGDVTFTPEADFVGDSTISYTVQDDQGETSNEALITVTVTEGLISDAGIDQTVFVEQTVTLDGSGSLPAGVQLMWAIVEQSSGSNAIVTVQVV